MDTIVIDVAAVPREVRDDLARPLLERVAAYFEQPGAEEAFQAWLKEYRRRPAASAATHRRTL